MLTPYQFASNSSISGIDLDGLEYYYAADGTFIGRGADPKNLEVRLAKVIGKTPSGNVKLARVDLQGNLQKNWTVIHENYDEFEQLAAFAYNETYSGGTHIIDKFRVANSIVNRNKGESMQSTLDNFRYNNDSKEDRENNVSKVPATGTAEYANFINTSVDDRNANDDMKAANAAAINALIPNGIDYTQGKNGEKGKQERGVGKGTTGLHNRFFTAYPPKPSNQISNFQNTTIPNNQNPFIKMVSKSLTHP